MNNLLSVPQVSLLEGRSLQCGFWPRNSQGPIWILPWICSSCFFQGKRPQKIHKKIHPGICPAKFPSDFCRGLLLNHCLIDPRKGVSNLCLMTCLYFRLIQQYRIPATQEHKYQLTVAEKTFPGSASTFWGADTIYQGQQNFFLIKSKSAQSCNRNC